MAHLDRLLPSNTAVRNLLLLPLVIPFLTFVPVEIYALCGGVIYAHGSSASLLLLGAGMSMCVLAWECFAVPYVVLAARKNKTPLRQSDILSILLAVAYIFLAAFFILKLVG